MFRKLLPIVIAICAIASSFVAPVLSSGEDIARDHQLSVTVAPATQASVSAAKSGVVQLIDLEGFKKLLTHDKQTKPLLVNFWATWCDPCRDEFPDLVKIDQDYRSKGLDFIAISLDDAADIKTAVPEFLQQVKATMPVYLLNVADPEPAIIAVDKEWGGALPATFLYDAQGKVVFKHFGRVQTPELRSAIEKVMTGKEQ